jgi:hypothetical protein
LGGICADGGLFITAVGSMRMTADQETVCQSVV